ncbi:G patch domain-containing protein 4 [Venturia canescens]|uniref:G patch domain-containing protein 4 n=1 Tax=Venturia canescens TaxID=32260 RepID=UPI001C9BF036|nr:G patch domain-containing protein 4 [Venturia canescens]
MSSFAKAQLLKFGWTEGKGLGKHENGIVEALKPKLKFDNTGIGHDAKEFKWWESVYEKASKNVKIIPVVGDQKEVRMTVKESDALQISTSQYTLENSFKKAQLQYGNFLKTCTLDNGRVKPETNVPEIKEVRIGEELTDEQLFNACGGRTAHKGARHGLKLSGKLARIARQEALLLGVSREVQSAENKEGNSGPVKERNKKKRKRDKGTKIEVIDLETLENVVRASSDENILSDTSERLQISKKSKKSRRKEKRRFEELASKLGSVAINDEKEPKKIITINLEHEEEEIVKSAKFTETERANFRIDKKKKKSSIKKANKRLESLSDSLMAFDLNDNSIQSERLSEELTSKLKKKRRKKKEIGKLKKSKSV